jgi:hypothetical protein
MLNTNSIFPFIAKKEKKVIITFTGGMGAQILSAAIYLAMKDAGKKVYADLTYFDTPAKLATEAAIGQVSQWAWQLSLFGINPSDFEIFTGKNSKKEDLIVDGPRKIHLGLTALQTKAISHYFSIPKLPPFFGLDGTKYVCAHIRRGDYINVASHLMADEEFLSATNTFSSLCDTLVVVSDSNLSESLKTRFSNQFKDCIFLDNIDAFTSHCIMRKANALICSNSQFSLVAAALKATGVVLIPKNWGEDQGIAKTIGDFGSFQTLNTCT